MLRLFDLIQNKFSRSGLCENKGYYALNSYFLCFYVCYNLSSTELVKGKNHEFLVHALDVCSDGTKHCRPKLISFTVEMV